MSYKFKVGDKGLTRCGFKYEVICTEAGYPREDMIAVINLPVSENGCTEYYKYIVSFKNDSGKYCTRQHDYDLMPPSIDFVLRIERWGGSDFYLYVYDPQIMDCSEEEWRNNFSEKELVKEVRISIPTK